MFDLDQVRSETYDDPLSDLLCDCSVCSSSALAVTALFAALPPVDAVDTVGRVQASVSFKIGY
jgi:hypothetical protein